MGDVEFVTSATTTDFRHRLSAYGEDVISLNLGGSTCPSPVDGICFNYIHGDHLGGVDAVTDVTGAFISGTSFGYEAFGQRRDPTTGAPPTSAQVQADRNLTHRGFTKHEMLDNVDLIHMNGRVYDPALGRFLSVDPVFLAPTNMQSLNPYSYVLNNPLSLTDPTGYAPQCPTDTTCNENGSGKELYDGKNAGNDNGNMTGSHAGFDTGIKGNDLKTLQGVQNGAQSPGGGQGTNAVNSSKRDEAEDASNRTVGKVSDPQSGGGNISFDGDNGKSGSKLTGPCEDPDNCQSTSINRQVIKIVGGFGSEQKKVQAELDRLESTPRGKELLQALLDKGRVIEIRIVKDLVQPDAKLSGKYFNVEPDFNKSVWTDKGTKPVSL